MSYFELQESASSPQTQKERMKARALKKTHWWQRKLQIGKCEACGKDSPTLTMDHVVPLARGGRSSKNNIQALCLVCNQEKGLKTHVDRLLECTYPNGL
jgi:5-methylcytosine-specific restriction enzyme A